MMTRDHPRSRGVYHDISFQGHGFGGSSPLARGLHGRVRRRIRPRRIIPARAGFTASDAVIVRVPLDHPRSRGVYFSDGEITRTPSGSSPLARGLQMYALISKPTDGIIPARAGFTPCIQVRSGFRGDHPRSRGVYYIFGRAPPSRPWIIPARAGFTPSRSRP